MKTLLIAAIMLAIGVTTAPAVTINNDEGGFTAPYHQRYKAIARSGERIVIDGPCYSACTLMFTYVPSDRICATSRAVIGVHKFWTMDFRTGRTFDNPVTTKAAMRHYPKAMQAQIAHQGGYRAMPAYGMWYLRGAQTGIRTCN